MDHEHRNILASGSIGAALWGAFQHETQLWRVRNSEREYRAEAFIKERNLKTAYSDEAQLFAKFAEDEVRTERLRLFHGLFKGLKITDCDTCIAESLKHWLKVEFLEFHPDVTEEELEA